MATETVEAQPAHAPAAGGENAPPATGAAAPAAAPPSGATAPAAGEGKQQPTPEQDYETAVNALSDLKDDATADERKAARDNFAKAKDARQKAQDAAKLKADTDAKAKATADAKAKADAAQDLDVSAEKLKLPENLSNSAADYLKGRQAQIAQFAKENKIGLKQAQAMINAEAATFTQVAAYGDAQLKAMGENWKAKNQADLTLGGLKFDENNTLAERAARTLFGNEFFDTELKGLHLMQHPDAWKGFVKLANLMGEARLVKPADAIPPEKTERPKTPGERVYGVRKEAGGDYDPAAVGGGSEPAV